MSLFHPVTSAANGRCTRDKWWVWEVTPNLGTAAHACHCLSWTVGAGELPWFEAQLGLLQKSDLWVINHHSESWGIQVQYAHECSEICPDPWFLTPSTDWNFHLASYLVGLILTYKTEVHGEQISVASMFMEVGQIRLTWLQCQCLFVKIKGRGFSRFKKFAYRGSTQHHVTLGYRYSKNF